MTIPVRRIAFLPASITVKNTPLPYAVKNIYRETEELDFLFAYRKQNRTADDRYRVVVSAKSDTGLQYYGYHCLGVSDADYRSPIVADGEIDPVYNMLFSVVYPFKTWIQDEYEQGNLVEGGKYRHNQYAIELATAQENDLLSSTVLVTSDMYDFSPRY